MQHQNPFVISSSRISLLAFNYRHLKKYIANNGSLEEELKLNQRYFSIPDNQNLKGVREISPAFIVSLKTKIIPAVNNPSTNYIFNPVWGIVCRDKNFIVSGISIKGEPNEKGEIEIGYGTNEAFKRNGYMTEAVGILSTWALQQKNVKVVLAETLTDNNYSQRVLQKNDLKKLRQSTESVE